VLLGSLAGPLLADAVGLVEALLISFVARALGAVAIWAVRQSTPSHTLQPSITEAN
jgi:hypothetical protein